MFIDDSVRLVGNLILGFAEWVRGPFHSSSKKMNEFTNKQEFIDFFKSEGMEINTPLSKVVGDIPSDETRLMTIKQIDALEEKATKISYDFVNFVICSFSKGTTNEGKVVYWAGYDNWDDFYAHWERLVEIQAERTRRALRGIE